MLFSSSPFIHLLLPLSSYPWPPIVVSFFLTHLLLEVVSPLSLPSPFCCHSSSKKQRNPLIKKILGLQAPMELTSPYRVIEDVLVRVKHFIFPTDFVVMDISEDTDIPAILGRPLMLTASCIVDMGKRKLELGFED